MVVEAVDIIVYFVPKGIGLVHSLVLVLWWVKFNVYKAFGILVSICHLFKLTDFLSVITSGKRNMTLL